MSSALGAEHTSHGFLSLVLYRQENAPALDYRRGVSTLIAKLCLYRVGLLGGAFSPPPTTMPMATAAPSPISASKPIRPGPINGPAPALRPSHSTFMSTPPV